MEVQPVPSTVEKALGVAAARDLEKWLESAILDASTRAHPPISAFVARQKVNGLMLDRISSQLLAGDPELINRKDGSLAWRVPIQITFPSRGQVGTVGTLVVDAQMGEIAFTDAELDKISQEAERLAAKLSS